ncbi:MAG: hemerythrin domain-containing protein, partial [Caulobacteraceae bacterium]|nr:hemerythrin domain-containing protein [Caulobacteraceae bacterium]
MARSGEESRTGSQPGETNAPEAGAAAASASAQQTPTAQAAKPQARPEATTTNGAAASASGQDAIALLKADHRKVEGLFAEFESADDARKQGIIREACQDLIVHTLLEERLFYPAARTSETEDKLGEAQVEHDAAKVLIVELLEGGGRDPYRDAKFKVLAEEIKHHVKEEEAPQGVFAKAEKAGINTPELAGELNRLKQQLQQKAQADRLPEPQPASFRHFGGPTSQERNMPIERDEQGRFTSDDDYRSRSRERDYDDDRGYRSRGSSDRDRDSRGRFASDDDDRSYRSRGSAGRDRDSQGRFTSDDDDDRGRSYGARSGGGRSRSQGGWFGDSEG